MSASALAMPIRPVTPAGIVLAPRSKREPQRPIAQLVGIGHVTADPAWRMSEHRHPMHELIVIVRGRLQVTIAEVTTMAQAGDVLWYEAGCLHGERSDTSDPVESYFIAWTWDEERPSSASAPLKRHDRHGLIRQLATWLYAARDADTVTAACKRSSLLQALLAEVEECDSAGAHADDLVPRVRTAMRERLDEQMTLTDLARVAGLSRAYFVRSFKRRTGRTPMEELRRLRLERACDLLLGTDQTLRVIAEQCGLASEFLLSRLFRRRYGMPPSRFRSSRAAAARSDKDQTPGHGTGARQ